MSIRQVQVQNVLEDVVRILYAKGHKPALNDILEAVSEYFALYPAGQPVSMPLNGIRNDTRSDVRVMNEIMATMSNNLDVLYHVTQDQVDEVMDLTTQLRSYMQRLTARRSRIAAQIDDYLLSLYNSDGYYYSISDVYSDLKLVDVSLTSAYVDTLEGYVRLPTVSSLSTRMGASQISTPTVKASVNGATAQYKTVAPWSGATDGLTNTIWSVEVETATPSEVMVQLEIDLGGNEISRLDLDPYGVTQAQYIVTAFNRTDLSLNGQQEQSFGNKIVTTLGKFSLVNDVIPVNTLKIIIRKTEHDYVDASTGVLKYRYVFGIKDLAITHQVYDNNCRVVSTPLSVPAELRNQYVIDAVSVTTDADVPPGTDIVYYVAEDSGGTHIGDFNWKKIDPVDTTKPNSTKVLRFNGARFISKDVVAKPDTSQLQLIAPDSTNGDLTKRNPSPSIIPGADTYRLCQFKDDTTLRNSFILEEGVNTVRWYTTTGSTDALSLDYWADKFATLTANYSRMDTGNGFFYAGDVGESDRSVYMETYVDVADDLDPIIADFRKNDQNSKTWDVKVYLNGREIGNLPAGIDKATIPYTFQQGLNHIAVVANIPPATNNVPNPYIGTIELMNTSHLYDYGTVKLATWNYVDLFDMKFNQTDQPYTFTTFNDEIISRRKPTTNFRVTYASNTSQGPGALRFRADLSRSSDTTTLTPTLTQYRLRFSYSE